MQQVLQEHTLSLPGPRYTVGNKKQPAVLARHVTTRQGNICLTTKNKQGDSLHHNSAKGCKCRRTRQLCTTTAMLWQMHACCRLCSCLGNSLRTAVVSTPNCCTWLPINAKIPALTPLQSACQLIDGALAHPACPCPGQFQSSWLCVSCTPALLIPLHRSDWPSSRSR